MLTTLKQGATGPLVESLQAFLRGTGCYEGTIDGNFGERTKVAVQAWQDSRQLCPDGVVGNMTWGSLMAAGLILLPEEDAAPDDRTSAHWPPKTEGTRSLNAAQRATIFGTLVTEPDPIQGNPENCRIVSRGPDYRIIEAAVPLLVGVSGFPKSGKVLMHAKAARPLQLLVEAWHEAGLLGRVLTWGGSLAVRYVRGSRTTLSPHAWGSAFDINVAWNGLGAQSALVGRKGSVRELVPIANGLGWFWGGHFSREDGMHFELCEVGT